MGGAILVAVSGPHADEWCELLRTHAPGRDIRQWPNNVGNPADVTCACVWRMPRGLLAGFPNLKAIIALSAGVDHLLADPALPDVPIARIIHRDLTMRMIEYIVLHVLMHHRRQRRYDAQQRQRVWKPHDQPPASDVSVGIMGLGVIGTEAAKVLVQIGFKVAGWSRTAKKVNGIGNFHGANGLDEFLARTEILVCVLPATPETDGILNLRLFRRLKRDGAAGGAFLINAARGQLQVDADIAAALEEGVLAGATLDVFPTEPLTPESPLWSHPAVTITPHNAGDISPRALIRDVIAQIERLESGLTLHHLVDRGAGY
ncbi:MAG: glyoxylate/hydroxypyruvate reductase A [Rhizobiales bacterium]|nr:glyoxylate/hydroxypyruvate reductase A [Hyphomicrobiales bacterium]